MVSEQLLSGHSKQGAIGLYRQRANAPTRRTARVNHCGVRRIQPEQVAVRSAAVNRPAAVRGDAFDDVQKLTAFFGRQAQRGLLQLSIGITVKEPQLSAGPDCAGAIHNQRTRYGAKIFVDANQRSLVDLAFGNRAVFERVELPVRVRDRIRLAACDNRGMNVGQDVVMQSLPGTVKDVAASEE